MTAPDRPVQPTAPAQQDPEGFPWDEEVQVVVTLRVRADRDPSVEVGDYGRDALQAAITAVQVGRDDLSRIDGFADLIGEARIVDVEKYL